MSLDEHLVDLLRCPESGQALRLISPEELESLRAALGAGRWAPRSGAPLKGALTGALVTKDGTLVYPILEGIPDLLSEDVLVERPAP